MGAPGLAGLAGLAGALGALALLWPVVAAAVLVARTLGARHAAARRAGLRVSGVVKVKRPRARAAPFAEERAKQEAPPAGGDHRLSGLESFCGAWEVSFVLLGSGLSAGGPWGAGEALARLEVAIERTLEAVPELSGRLDPTQRCRRQGYPRVVRFPCSGIRLEVAEAPRLQLGGLVGPSPTLGGGSCARRGAPPAPVGRGQRRPDTSPAGEPASFHIAGVDSAAGALCPRLGATAAAAGRAPLLALRATALGCGGRALGVTFHHSLADGFSAFQFLRLLAFHWRAHGAPAKLLPPFPPPSYTSGALDRLLVGEGKGDIESGGGQAKAEPDREELRRSLPLNEAIGGGADGAGSCFLARRMAGPLERGALVLRSAFGCGLLQARLRLSKSALAALRRAAGTPSSHDAVSALLFQSFGRTLRPHRSAWLSVSVEMRRALGAPEEAMGSFVVNAMPGAYKAKEVGARGLIDLAADVRAAILRATTGDAPREAAAVVEEAVVRDLALRRGLPGNAGQMCDLLHMSYLSLDFAKQCSLSAEDPLDMVLPGIHYPLDVADNTVIVMHTPRAHVDVFLRMPGRRLKTFLAHASAALGEITAPQEV